MQTGNALPISPGSILDTTTPVFVDQVTLIIQIRACHVSKELMIFVHFLYIHARNRHSTTRGADPSSRFHCAHGAETMMEWHCVDFALSADKGTCFCLLPEPAS